MKRVAVISVLFILLSFSGLYAGIAALPTAVFVGSMTVSTSSLSYKSVTGLITTDERDVETRMVSYVKENSNMIARDISRGGGDSLTGLSDILSIGQEKRPGFYSVLQRNFDSIFEKDDNSPEHIAHSIIELGKKYNL